jgi:hypothetical protein
MSVDEPESVSLALRSPAEAPENVGLGIPYEALVHKLTNWLGQRNERSDTEPQFTSTAHQQEHQIEQMEVDMVQGQLYVNKSSKISTNPPIDAIEGMQLPEKHPVRPVETIDLRTP